MIFLIFFIDDTCAPNKSNPVRKGVAATLKVDAAKEYIKIGECCRLP